MENLFVNVPGIGNSGEGHWQTLWERKYSNFMRVDQYCWDFPVSSQWVLSLERLVHAYQHHPIYLVAHSMGCHTIAQWAAKTKLRVEGALLVAPPDVARLEYTGRVSGYIPEPNGELPFRSVVVASSNDPYASLAKAVKYAGIWGSQIVSVDRKGHINAGSELGDWRQGLDLLSFLVRSDQRKVAS
ncbi:MAG: alpha/beta fold hydrolase [Breznakibacter sp.]